MSGSKRRGREIVRLRPASYSTPDLAGMVVSGGGYRPLWPYVVGWSMKPTLSRELALDALIMAVWRRKPDEEVIVHSDLGSQYGSDDWQRFCRANNLAPSMSRRGNCWDTRSNILSNTG